ncbi:MAG: PHP domain-containing protein [Ktedonobacterales bacterium]
MGQAEPATQMTTIRGTDAIDLHMHTTYSDGHWQPTALFAQLAREGFRVVAVTDHDQVRHLAGTQALGISHGIVVVPGTEMTTVWHGMNAHVLCYAPVGVGFTSEALADLARSTEDAQLANTRAVHEELLRRGYTFPRQDDILRAQGGQVARPIDNARLIHESGYAPTPADALAVITDAGYISIKAPIAEAVAAAHASGAVTIMAHPGRGEGEIQRYDPPLLRELLADIPLDGLEVYYPTYTPKQIAAYAALAAERDLLVSAGSDSHGPRQRYPIRYPAERCAALLKRLRVRVE